MRAQSALVRTTCSRSAKLSHSLGAKLSHSLGAVPVATPCREGTASSSCTSSPVLSCTSTTSNVTGCSSGGGERGAGKDTVRLVGRGLTKVPTSLREDAPGRPRVRKVDISRNELTNLVGLPQSVTQLRASCNHITGWDGLQMLPRLQRVDLSDNRLRRIGPVGMCCAIRVLNLRNNRIATIGGVEGLARTLTSLDIANNLLSSVNDVTSLGTCTRLTVVHLAGNPLMDGIPRTSRSRACRNILARLPPGLRMLDEMTVQVMRALKTVGK